jgi:hypothetical protein
MALSRPITEQHSRSTAIKNQTSLILEGGTEWRVMSEVPAWTATFKYMVFLYLLASWVISAEWSTRHVRTLTFVCISRILSSLPISFNFKQLGVKEPEFNVVYCFMASCSTLFGVCLNRFDKRLPVEHAVLARTRRDRICDIRYHLWHLS